MEANSSSSNDASAGAWFSAALGQIPRICRNYINHIFLTLKNAGSKILKTFIALCGHTSLPPALSSSKDYTDSKQKPIFMDESESNYQILEEKINNIEKKYSDLSIEYSQLQSDYTSIEAELKIMVEEKFKSENLCDETNTKYLEKVNEMNDKIRLKVKELRLTQATVISKDLIIISLRTKIAEIEKLNCVTEE